MPTQVNFEMFYAPVNGHWRLFGLSVSFGQAAPAAPDTPDHAASAVGTALTGMERSEIRVRAAWRDRFRPPTQRIPLAGAAEKVVLRCARSVIPCMCLIPLGWVM